MSYTIFDIETRIEKSLVRAVYFPHAEEDGISDEDAYSQIQQRLRAEQGNDFFPLSFHVPISIVVGQVNDEHVLARVETVNADKVSESSQNDEKAEEALVRTFWQRFEKFPGTLVSFNGRGFDLPVLELHALKYGCRLPRYFSGKSRYRFSDEGHYDLYDFLTNYGVHRLRGGLNVLAKMIGLPGKTDIDGSMVQELWQDGRSDDIHRYCRNDVIQTYFLFLRVELLRGRLTHEQYDYAVKQSVSFRQELQSSVEPAAERAT